MLKLHKAIGLLCGMLAVAIVASLFLLGYSAWTTAITTLSLSAFYALLWKAAAQKDADSLKASADARLLSSSLDSTPSCDGDGGD